MLEVYNDLEPFFHKVYDIDAKISTVGYTSDREPIISANTSYGIVIFKLDVVGNVIRAKLYSSNQTAKINNIAQIEDKDYITAGSITVDGNSDIWISRINRDGSIEFNGDIDITSRDIKIFKRDDYEDMQRDKLTIQIDKYEFKKAGDIIKISNSNIKSHTSYLSF